MSALNSSCKIEKYKLDSIDILICDDILVDPVGCRHLAIKEFALANKKRVASKAVRKVNDIEKASLFEIYPAKKNLDVTYSKITQSISALVDEHIGIGIREHFEIPESNENTLSSFKNPYFNAVYGPPQFLPHVDAGHISTFIYLNPATQCCGGTAIYRHIPTGMLFSDQKKTQLDWLCQTPLSEPLRQSTSEWKLELVLEMKFNRLVAFNSSVIHKIHWPENAPYKKNIKQARLTFNNFYRYI